MTPARRRVVPERFARPLPRAAILGAVAALAVPAPAFAHHGRDFLFSQTADLPHPGEVYLIPRQGYLDAGEEREVEFEPSVLVGILHWLAGEVHGHAAKEIGTDAEYESTAVAAHLRLLPERRAFRLGLSGEYERSHHDGEPDRLEGRIEISSAPGLSLMALNLVGGDARGDGLAPDWGYSIGYRRAATHHLAWGFEAQGALERSEHEVLAGLYLDPTSRFTVNVGAGVGLGDSELDLSIRAVFVGRLAGPGGSHE